LDVTEHGPGERAVLVERERQQRAENEADDAADEAAGADREQ
jgi:hypothetical protein